MSSKILGRKNRSLGEQKYDVKDIENFIEEALENGNIKNDIPSPAFFESCEEVYPGITPKIILYLEKKNKNLAILREIEKIERYYLGRFLVILSSILIFFTLSISVVLPENPILSNTLSASFICLTFSSFLYYLFRKLFFSGN